MNNIAVVTDSTSDLPASVYEGYDLSVLPLSVVFENKVYLDGGIDIKEDDFYKKMESSAEMPKAAPPSPGNFLNIYSKLTSQEKEIISIHISRKLSGTLNAAELVARQFGKDKIDVIDSEVVHMSCGFMALKAAKMAKEGTKREDILKELSSFRNKINSFFIPKSLDNLIKGGRINKIKGKFANLLEIKPVLTIK